MDSEKNNFDSWDTEIGSKLLQDSLRIKNTPIKDLMEQNDSPYIEEFEGIYLDFSRQKIDNQILSNLVDYAKEMQVFEKIQQMYDGNKINNTEGRAALHVALRMNPSSPITINGRNVIHDVIDVLNHIKQFSQDVRTGNLLGCYGNQFETIVCVGIGGSYLGTEFVYEALKSNEEAKSKQKNLQLKFLANVDPINFTQVTHGLDAKKTMVIIISKTFTTAETMMNAQLMKEWLIKNLQHEEGVAKHMVAISTNTRLTNKFGINPCNVFGFWDWVGGRYSVTSAVGILPLSLVFSFDYISEFLVGCHAMDMHFLTAPPTKNLPILMALTSFWNSTFMGWNSVAILPYSQALHRFPAHIQQLIMESNGKSVDCDGNPLKKSPCEVYFGEPGTNGQHSFYQLLHQGQTVPAEFIGFCKAPLAVSTEGSPITAHDELMANFFAQPDALAIGKSALECATEKIPGCLIPHRVFKGDKPSMMLLLPELTPYFMGCLLALYEHRTVTQAFLWKINPFDQWGVELGKVAAKEIRDFFISTKDPEASEVTNKFTKSTKKLLQIYCETSSTK